MTSASPGRYALFSSGAGFGRAVLAELLRLGCPPQGIVLPGFPPAAVGRQSGPGLLASSPRPGWPGAGFDDRLLHVPPGRQEAGARQLRQWRCDFLLVACWPWLIGAELMASVSAAALNLHPSLLPDFRGPHPVADQLAAGDSRFGITLHLLDAQFDHGDIVAQRQLPDGSGPVTAQAIENCCAVLGAAMFVDAMNAFPNWRRRPQAVQGPETD